MDDKLICCDLCNTKLLKLILTGQKTDKYDWTVKVFCPDCKDFTKTYRVLGIFYYAVPTVMNSEKDKLDYGDKPTDLFVNKVETDEKDNVSFYVERRTNKI